MASDDELEPRLGRMRAKGKGGHGRKFMHRVLAAANLARGGAARPAARSKFTGARIGRGAGTGRVLSARDRYAAFRNRRVIVKARTVSLRGPGFDGAKAHLRYVERDGTQRDGERGRLYGAESDVVDRANWLERSRGDRHQFRFIVSPEDGLEYDDLKSLTRRLITRAEEDLGTRLDWVAVDHFNTGHPHTHIIVRGKDDRGKDLIIARDYIGHGLRERACELVDLDLGPKTDHAIEQRLRAEVEQERFTSIDRALLRESGDDILVSTKARGAFDQTIRMGRLRKLERLGLASQLGAAHWKLASDLEPVLRKMGERGDIIRTMQRAYSERGVALAVADQAIYDPSVPGTASLVGRIVERGLSDEHADRHYLIVEATDGRSHYVEAGKDERLPSCPPGAIVRIVPVEPTVRDADRTVADVAAANGGRYTVDAHLRFDPSASQEFAEAHVRRLEAMRRMSGGTQREPDGTWHIASDHLERAAAYEVARARDQPVTVEILSPEPIERIVEARAATWLDRELVADTQLPLREAGFGKETSGALAIRRQWLLDGGFAVRQGERVIVRNGALDELCQLEIRSRADVLAREIGKPFAEPRHGERIEGRLVGPVDLLSGRHALVERSRDFVLVPWRPVLERQVGKPVAGIMRDQGVSWQIGRQRSGPSVS
ncbi:conjugal transfer protein TraI [Sphingopyxis sp. H038]|uniref:relaxase/mobilization nuclease RlxS n=1 Tax=unclassified Sphingopyxis TaxID=2614943 RepID=UPI0007309B75|nr:MULTISPECIES: relaxase/mobilization nuclease RlxS [unclassified Sphingopyxis]KTE04319.1 conjugal transfer protein TraI [Sphingopyxis sp. H012]KTE10840.1 conjugal transfer protein TraI [Sphingopyxis sp. H093]KTE13479.1 conjugal transfer protein TraI [Sphingopyxis sp. H053]KTE25660.1 conjugal transfer protein TraI [Sphingopyxis sp. H080]KTE36809.1 conjugal transfer protein TraI [Sphingopyxis sp. H038]